MQAGAVVVGLDALLRDARAAGNKAATRDLYRGLRAAGNIVRDEARAKARGQGLQDSGALVRGVRVTRANARAVEVTATAKRDGFPYPSLYEYGRGRPFMEPGLEAAAPKALRELQSRIDQTLREHNL